MATATSEEQGQNRSDLLTCPVCLENMVEGRPRSLRCLHTFCQSCLEQCQNSVVNRCLECPLCKAETIIPEEGVKGLPLDFKVKQISEMLKAPSGSLDNCGFCLFKQKNAQAISFCKECELLLCKECDQQHNNMFTGHIVTPRSSSEELTIRCESHFLVMKYYCLECKMFLCPVCMMAQKHSEHQDKTMPIDKARINIQSVVITYIEKLESFNEKLQKDLQKKLAVSDTLSEIAKQIHKKGLEQKKIIDDRINALISDLESNYRSTVEKSIEEHQNIITSNNDTMEMLKSISMGEMMGAYKDVDGKIEVLQEKVETAHVEVDKLIVPIFSSTHHIEWNLKEAERGKVDMRTFDPQNGCILNPKTRTDAPPEIVPVNKPECSGHQTFKKCIHLTAADVEMKGPVEIAILSDNSVVFSDIRLYHVTRLDQRGRLVRTYTPDEAAGIMDCMWVFGDIAYIVHNKHLTTFSTKDKIPQFTTREFGHVGCDDFYTLALDNNENIYIGNTSGQVFKFKPGSTIKKQVTYIGEDHNAFVSVADVGGWEVLVVCDEDGNRVFLIDTRTGRRLARIENNFNRPSAATGTPSGTILIADTGNHRIAEYTRDGDCLGYPLTEADGLFFPLGLAYKHPYMWITETNSIPDHRSIKMYKYQ